jgi:tRNA-splicing ligase RtcB
VKETIDSLPLQGETVDCRHRYEDHARTTAGIECRKDAGVLDETPGAYKDIDAVMAAQSDLVEVVTVLRQVVTVKG